MKSHACYYVDENCFLVSRLEGRLAIWTFDDLARMLEQMSHFSASSS